MSTDHDCPNAQGISEYWALSGGCGRVKAGPSLGPRLRRRAGPLWQGAVAFASGGGSAPPRPYQVEVHLRQEGRPGCLLRCADCLGQCLRTQGGLPPELWLRLFDDLIEMGVGSVVCSGIYSDPLCLEQDLLVRLLDKGGPHWGVKLYTYGIQLTAPIRQAVVRAALAGPAGRSYVRFSKPTVDPRVAEVLCRPQGMGGATLLRREEANLQAMFEQAEACGFPLLISLNCRVTQINGDPRSLADLLRWFADTPAPVRLRFTTDYEPTNATPAVRKRFADLYVEPDDAWDRVQAAIELARFRAVDRLSFRAVAKDSACHVPRCLNRLLFAAVSADGKVFPCQGIAAKAFESLACGDLRTARFPQVWSDFADGLARGGPDPVSQQCPHCAAAGEQLVNLALAIEAEEYAAKGPFFPTLAQ